MIYIVTQQESLSWSDSGDTLVRFVTQDLRRAKEAFLDLITRDEYVGCCRLQSFTLDSTVSDAEAEECIFMADPGHRPEMDRELIAEIRASLDKP